MKGVIILSSVLSIALATDTCLKEVLEFCKDADTSKIKHCDSTYTSFDPSQSLSKLVELHISTNFNYLLMTTHFGNFEENREGMIKIFRHLSDETWSDAIELIKYMTKRGFSMTFTSNLTETAPTEGHSEIKSLSSALDYQKNIASDTIAIHSAAINMAESDKSDPEVASFLENNFLHRHADVIRKLSGLVNDLKNLLVDDSKAVSTFIFDEYLLEM